MYTWAFSSDLTIFLFQMQRVIKTECKLCSIIMFSYGLHWWFIIPDNTRITYSYLRIFLHLMKRNLCVPNWTWEIVPLKLRLVPSVIVMKQRDNKLIYRNKCFGIQQYFYNERRSKPICPCTTNNSTCISLFEIIGIRTSFPPRTDGEAALV